jgi:hypothetical protein
LFSKGNKISDFSLTPLPGIKIANVKRFLKIHPNVSVDYLSFHPETPDEKLFKKARPSWQGCREVTNLSSLGQQYLRIDVESYVKRDLFISMNELYL